LIVNAFITSKGSTMGNLSRAEQAELSRLLHKASSADGDQGGQQHHDSDDDAVWVVHPDNTKTRLTGRHAAKHLVDFLGFAPDSPEIVSLLAGSRPGADYDPYPVLGGVTQTGSGRAVRVPSDVHKQG
jgi:hypothetical protein